MPKPRRTIPLVHVGQVWSTNYTRRPGRDAGRKMRIVSIVGDVVTVDSWSPRSDLVARRYADLRKFAPYKDERGHTRQPKYVLIEDAPAQAGAA